MRCHIARPNSSGTYSGRQNIYGYFHGIFARNGCCFPPPRGYGFRSKRNSQAPTREITPPSQDPNFSFFFLDDYFPCPTLDQPTRALPPCPARGVKPVENKTFLVTQPLQKFASPIPTKAIQENKEAGRPPRQTPSLAVSNRQQLLKVISPRLYILIPKFRLEKAESKRSIVTCSGEGSPSKLFLSLLTLLTLIQGIIISLCRRDC